MGASAVRCLRGAVRTLTRGEMMPVRRVPNFSSSEAALACWRSGGSGAALWFVFSHGWNAVYGDAQAHCDCAPVFDAREPGYEQIGTVWLPLPHLLMLPFVQTDALWRSGLGGALPVAGCFVIGGLFLFLGMRRLLGRAAAWTAAAIYGLNPNLLYLQSTRRRSPVFFCCCFAGLFYSLARWGSR